MTFSSTAHSQRSKSDIELVSEMDKPAPENRVPELPGPYFPDSRSWPAVRAQMQAHSDWEVAEHARSVAAARAELERRRVDVEAVRRKIRAFVAQLRKLPHFEVTMLSLDLDDNGHDLSIVAADFLLGRFDDE
jgi:hypothetical protein